MTFPTSNVRVIKGHTFTDDDFNNCAECCDGKHGAVEDGLCICCRIDPTVKSGTFVPFTRKES
jgi:hypothetical protein